MVHIKEGQRQLLVISAVFGAMVFLFSGLVYLVFSTLNAISLPEVARFFLLLLVVCIVGFFGSTLLYIEGTKRLHANFDKIQKHVFSIFTVYLVNLLIIYFALIRHFDTAQKQQFFLLSGLGLLALLGVMIFEFADHHHKKRNPRRKYAYALYSIEVCVWIAAVGIAYLLAMDAYLIFSSVSALFAV